MFVAQKVSELTKTDLFAALRHFPSNPRVLLNIFPSVCHKTFKMTTVGENTQRQSMKNCNLKLVKSVRQMYQTKKYNICLCDTKEWKERVAKNGNTQVHVPQMCT